MVESIDFEKDLNGFSVVFTKVTVGEALNAEFDDHLGYYKNQKANNVNSRNGHSKKTV